MEVELEKMESLIGDVGERAIDGGGLTEGDCEWALGFLAAEEGDVLESAGEGGGYVFACVAGEREKMVSGGSGIGGI